ncbi:potassium channel family protein [Inediibacterium massiliense]|uniref:potassium channel family protein n=1 Tax=Inediibacterium massiliense TaxID=1658111 RepID=UPI0006B4010B|nr:potassium channel family protein [Inediibacterium massiliense]
MSIDKVQKIYEYKDINRELINSQELSNEERIVIKCKFYTYKRTEEYTYIQYYILRSEKEVDDFLQKYGSAELNKDDIGAIIACDYIIHSNVVSYFLVKNLIFLESLEVESSFLNDEVYFYNCIFDAIFFKNNIIEEYCGFDYCVFKDLVRFEKCKFEGTVEFANCSFEENNSYIENAVKFYECEFIDSIKFIECYFKVNTFFTNSICNKNFKISNSLFYKKLSFCDSNFYKECHYEKITFEDICDFSRNKFKSFSYFKDIRLNENAILNFIESNFYDWVDLKFDCNEKVKGKIIFYRTNFHSKCYLDYEMLEKDKFNVFIFDQSQEKYLFYINKYIGTINKVNKWSLFYASQIYKNNGKLEPHLTTYYLYKKFERLEKKEQLKNTPFSTKKILKKIDLIMSSIIEKTTNYFTSWKKTLVSIFLIIFCSFFIYALFPNYLKNNGVPITNKNTISLICSYVKNNQINLLLSKFLDINTWYKISNVFYFSIITFTTIGYGDISPTYMIKLFAGIEGLLGVFFSAAFLVSLSKNFLD